MDVKDVLEGAKRIVEQGWNQGANTDGFGNYCLRAALGLASGAFVHNSGSVTYASVDYNTATSLQLRDQYIRIKLDLAANEIVKASLPTPFNSIPVFNDQRGTTKNDVLAVLDKAIQSC